MAADESCVRVCVQERGGRCGCLLDAPAALATLLQGHAVCGGQRLHLLGWWIHRAIIGSIMATRLLHEYSLQMCGQCCDGAGLLQHMLLQPGLTRCLLQCVRV